MGVLELEVAAVFGQNVGQRLAEGWPKASRSSMRGCVLHILKVVGGREGNELGLRQRRIPSAHWIVLGKNGAFTHVDSVSNKKGVMAALGVQLPGDGWK